jgi:hypothetical protein
MVQMIADSESPASGQGAVAQARRTSSSAELRTLTAEMSAGWASNRRPKILQLGDTDGVSEGSSEKRALRSNARRAQRVIRSLLLEWDAIGAGVPDDEYDCMIWPLYKLIHQRSSNDEIAAWVEDYRRDHFGLEGEGESDMKLAERLLAAFTDQ